jgi:hypothetical protein
MGADIGMLYVGDVYTKALSTQQKMRANLAMAKDRLKVLGK